MAIKAGLNQWTANNGKFTLITTVLVLFVTLFVSPVIFGIPSEYLPSDMKAFLLLIVNSLAGFLKGVDKVIGIDIDSTDTTETDGGNK
jgi:hypothetical protein